MRLFLHKLLIDVNDDWQNDVNDKMTGRMMNIIRVIGAIVK